MRKRQCLLYRIGDPLREALPACHCRTGFCRSGLARNIKVDPIHGNMTHLARESRHKNLFLKLSTQNWHKYFWTHKTKCRYTKNHYRWLNIGANFSNNQAPTQRTFRCTSCNCEIDRYMVSKIIKQIKGTKISQKTVTFRRQSPWHRQSFSQTAGGIFLASITKHMPCSKTILMITTTDRPVGYTNFFSQSVDLNKNYNFCSCQSYLRFSTLRSNVVLPLTGIKKRKKKEVKGGVE